MAQRTRRYLIRRVTVVLLTLFVVTLLSFLLMRLSPVDPATAYVKRNSAVVTQEQIDEARVMLGLDKPLPVQYFDWVVDALHMDFGISLGTGNPVTEELAKTVPVTLTVVAYSAVIMSLGVLGVGMLGYLWRQKAGGMILSFLTIFQWRSVCRSWGSASMGRCWRPHWNGRWSRTTPCTYDAADCGRGASSYFMRFPTLWWTSCPALPRCWGCALPMRPL